MIKKFFHYLFKLCTEELVSKTSEMQVFDLVSTVPSPRPDELYVVYAIDNENVFLIKWFKYGNGGTFDANIDKQVCFTLSEAKKTLFKVVNYKIKLENIIMHCSEAELNTFATRLHDVFVRLYPVMGMFIDPNDNHLMLVTNQVGSLDEGHSTIYDLDLAPVAGIFHFNQIAHVVKTRDYIKGKYFATITKDHLKALFLGRPWRNEIIHDILERMLQAIIESEKYEYPSPIILDNGLTRCINNQDNNTTSDTRQNPAPLTNPQDKQTKETKK